MACAIPIVDFSLLSLDVSNEALNENEKIREVANEIIEAFTTIGFVYLTNTAFPKRLVFDFD